MSAVEQPSIADYRRHLLVCTGPRCTADGEAQALFGNLGAIFKAAGLDQGELRVKRSRVSCFAACRGGPIRAAGWHLVLQRHAGESATRG